MFRFILGLAFVLSTSAAAAAHVSSIPGYKLNPQDFTIEKVSGSVYILVGTGGNIGVSYGDDGLLTVDTQYAANVPGIRGALAKLGSDKPRFTFNTHFHGDHTGGNVLFGADAIIIAQENVRTRLLSKVDRNGNPQEPMAKAGLPMITYYDGLSINFNGERIKAVHFPKGHTDGDTVIFFTGSNVVHLGDDFFAGRFPFVDLASGGNVAGLIHNIGKLLQMIPIDAKLIPGHGPVSTIKDLAAYHQMLIDTTMTVRGHMSEGKSLDEIKKAGLGEQYKSWSPADAFIKEDRWIETIYNSYSVKMEK